MRIVSGSCKARVITPPLNFKARPTTDFAKENIFNVINNVFDIDELEVLDLFSGTGAISFEFASRGAKSVTSIEIERDHQAFIKRTAELLKLTAVKSMRMNAFTFIKSCRLNYDFIFADPPYDLEGLELIPDSIFKKQMLREDGWFILEHSKNKDFSEHPNFFSKRTYGSVNFTIFTNITTEVSKDTTVEINADTILDSK